MSTNEKKKRGRPPNDPATRKKKLNRIGRPSASLPDAWKPAVKAMADAGKSLDTIRQHLLTMDVQVTRESILQAMHADKTRNDEIVKQHGDTSLVGLDGPVFDEFRQVVDDFIVDGRSPERIRAYLVTEGFVVTTEEVETYTAKRTDEWLREATGPYAAEVKTQRMHTRTLRRRLVEIWHNMPKDKRYTERMFGLILAEYGSSMRWELEKLKAELEGGDGKTLERDAANAEIEKKLGLIMGEPKEEQTPSGAEAPMGATV